MPIRRVNQGSPAATPNRPTLNPPARRRPQTTAEGPAVLAPPEAATIPEPQKHLRSRAQPASARPKRKPTGDYEVGNCRPPISGQIKPGEVRNPRGRPKGALGQDAIARKLLSEKRVVRIGPRAQKMTLRELLQRTSLREALEERKHQPMAHWLAEARRLFPEPDDSEAQGSREPAFSAADDLVFQMLLEGLSPAAAAVLTPEVASLDVGDADDGD